MHAKSLTLALGQTLEEFESNPVFGASTGEPAFEPLAFNSLVEPRLEPGVIIVVWADGLDPNWPENVVLGGGQACAEDRVLFLRNRTPVP